MFIEFNPSNDTSLGSILIDIKDSIIQICFKRFSFKSLFKRILFEPLIFCHKSVNKYIAGVLVSSYTINTPLLYIHISKTI